MGIGYNPKIVTDGLVLCLDAANRKSYPGSGTSWTDLSGLGNNGTLTNGPTFSSINNGSIAFDGSNDYTAINNSTSLSNFTNKLTIEICCEYITTSGGAADGYPSILMKTTDANWNNGFGFYWFNNEFNFFINNWDTNRVSYSVTGTIPVAHFCGVYDGTSMTLYRNGLITSTKAYNINISNSTNQLFIGSGTLALNSASYFTNSKVYNTKIYNRALSAIEVQQNFNALRGRYGI
jgi:hypothetical protein